MLRWRKLWILPFQGDWGLVWTAPFWLFILVWGLRNFNKLVPAARAGVLWMASEFAICALWKGNGSDFGYRYLIGSYAGALMVWLEFLKMTPKRWLRFSEVLLLLNAFWLFWLEWIYKEHVRVTTSPNQIGLWSNPDLQLNSLAALFDPEFYLLPLRHSPLAALYVSWQDPHGLSSFSLGTGDFRFWVTAFGACTALLGIAVLGRMTLRNLNSRKASPRSKSR